MSIDKAIRADIVSGNARVVRPRLSDARFFYNQDRKNGFVSRMVSRRRKLLDYLKGKTPERYTALIAKLGLRK